MEETVKKVSVVIPHYPWGEEIQEKLKSCVSSLVGVDEVIIVVNDKIGFAKAVNQGMRVATGDYICVVNNDVIVQGDIRDLCIPETVTSPLVNGRTQDFWGCFFCVPKSVYEKVGGLDEEFEIGYFEDDAYIITLQRAGIAMKSVSSVSLETEGGATMDKLPDRNEIFQRNAELFKKKYG